MTALSAPTYSHLDALVTFMTGFVLPSGDIYSDIGLSVKLLNNSCDAMMNTTANITQIHVMIIG